MSQRWGSESMASLDYLLEIGTEELPVSFLETAPLELCQKAQEALEKARFSFQEIETFYTPRRMALLIRGLSAHQTAYEEVLKGPPVSVGLDSSGNHTAAAMGFARKMGVIVTDLKPQSIEGTDYLTLQRHETGRPLEAVLPEILPEIVFSLSGSHFMVWDETEVRFSRPIRWVVSLLNNTLLPLRLGKLQAQTETFGHRFFAKTCPVPLSDVNQYVSVLREKGHVWVNPTERRAYIETALIEKASTLKGHVVFQEGLLETVSNLVETPVAIVGHFAAHFLTLPKEVIITVMSAHQKYFAVEDAQGHLLPHFITIANNPLPEAEESIRLGNERVLRARLEDASFFYRSDTDVPLSHFTEALHGITFQKGLGTLFDKSDRLKRLVVQMGQSLAYAESEVASAMRAATLCKADLATNLVKELTELQGIMGQVYALHAGEEASVALAIREHYHPRFLGDTVAQSPVGVLLSLADKLDSMVTIFSDKNARIPTGSKDPMGLRRMAMGVIQTMVEHQLPLDLDQTLQYALDNLDNLTHEPQADCLAQTKNFLLQRFRGYLLDQAFSYDTIEAVLCAEVSPLENITGTLARLTCLKGLQSDPKTFKALYEPANRIARILGEAYLPETKLEDLSENLLEDLSEKALFEVISRASFKDLSLAEKTQLLSTWETPIEAFFNKVMVNAENPAIRRNRYRLLSLYNKVYRQLADFTKLVV